jgi:hypothetical protein
VRDGWKKRIGKAGAPVLSDPFGFMDVLFMLMDMINFLFRLVNMYNQSDGDRTDGRSGQKQEGI